MRRLLWTAAVIFVASAALQVVGTWADLAYHAVMEPDEVFPKDAPLELIDHLVILGGLVFFFISGAVLAVWGLTRVLKERGK